MTKISLFLLAMLVSSCHAQPVYPPHLQELKSRITDNFYPKIDAVIIEQNNKIIFEEYFNGFTNHMKHDTRSSFKSITSLLAGIAVDKKLISVDDNLGRFFPELKDERKR
ncbi:MAG: hypothetical protein ABW036_14480, partial [Flavitalea sp.]